MIKELKKRINTSFLLFLFIYICVFINIYISLASLILLSFLGWIEFTQLTKKIFFKKKKLLYNFIILMSLIYFSFLIFICFDLISTNQIFFIYILSICIASDDIKRPLRRIFPELSFCNPAKVLKIVVFPIPEGPSNETISP